MYLLIKKPLKGVKKKLQETYKVNKLEWDTRYFGIDSARVELLAELSTTDQIEVMNLIEKYKFTTLVNYNFNNMNNLWLSNLENCYFVDVNVQYQKQIVNQMENYIENKSILHSKDNVIESEIIHIAQTSFNYSRFYNDPFLEKEKAMNIYVEWVKSSFKNQLKEFLIYKNESGILGFLLYSILDSQAKIELIAVKNNSLNIGIGKLLYQYLQSHLINQNIDTVIVGTQVNNIHANNFYTKCGFKMSGVSTVFHLWNK